VSPPQIPTFSTVIGHLAGKKKLSDAVMPCALQYIFSYQSTLSYAVDPLHVERSTFVFPATTLSKYTYVIVPVYMRSLKHWLIQIVSLPLIEDAQGEGQAEQHFKLVLYDPLGVEGHIDVLRATWKEFTLPLLRKWHARDFAKANSSVGDRLDENSEVNTFGANYGEVSAKRKSLEALDSSILSVSEVEEVLLHPKQPDSVSCGVLCLALAYSHVVGAAFERQKIVARDDVAAMRMCLMWQLICDCDERQEISDPDRVATNATTKLISKYFEATNRSENAV
jgi:hypothetical protein